MYIKSVVDIGKIINVDWKYICELRHDFCHCISLTTDLESYIEIDGHPDCVPKFEYFVQLYVNDKLLKGN